jgi:hypothetical protein
MNYFNNALPTNTWSVVNPHLLWSCSYPTKIWKLFGWENDQWPSQGWLPYLYDTMMMERKWWSNKPWWYHWNSDSVYDKDKWSSSKKVGWDPKTGWKYIPTNIGWRWNA